MQLQKKNISISNHPHSIVIARRKLFQTPKNMWYTTDYNETPQTRFTVTCLFNW